MATLTRDPDFIKSNLYTENNKLYTKEKTIIEFPKWYEDKNLLSYENKTSLYAIFALIIGDKYSVSTIPTTIYTNPVTIEEVKRGDTEYYRFVYGKGNILIEDLNVIKKELLSFNMFESFFIQARVPWFIEYEDLIKLLDNLEPYAKSALGSSYIATELVCSFISRSKEDKLVFFRQYQKSHPEYVDLLNVYYSALSTTGKIAGNYFTQALVSSIVQKQQEVTKLETFVRQ